jgi:hypothetical protein
MEVLLRMLLDMLEQRNVAPDSKVAIQVASQPVKIPVYPSSETGP